MRDCACSLLPAGLRMLALACALPLTMGFSHPSASLMLRRTVGTSALSSGVLPPGARMIASAAAASRSTIQLPTGLNMEYFEALPSAGAAKAPLVLVHGSFHGGWCWTVP
ncbi:hypothetical protein T484DRAFT_1854400 [Baffinella frigidus]|nr:hypothetical protein T484DRAFT_1854400 [Cryptophyta sp. CCMP2293]